MTIVSNHPITVEFRGEGDFAYKTSLSVGADLVAQKFDPTSPYAKKLSPNWNGACWVLEPFRPVLIPTGVFIVPNPTRSVLDPVHPAIYELPPFMYSLDVRPRSSWSVAGIVASLGTIDADYNLEILACLTVSEDKFHIHPGDRIGQLVGQMNFRIGGVPVTHVSRQGGIGSTGK